MVPLTNSLKHAAACRSEPKFSWGPLVLAQGAGLLQAERDLIVSKRAHKTSLDCHHNQMFTHNQTNMYQSRLPHSFGKTCQRASSFFFFF